MSDIEIGNMPSGMPDDIMRELDYTAAIRFIADDIANSCGKGKHRCAIATLLVEADSPIRFEKIEEHIPETAEYTAEEVLSLFCSVATFKEDSKNPGRELESASRRVDRAKTMKEYHEAMDSFMSVYSDIGQKAQSNYDIWMDKCYA